MSLRLLLIIFDGLADRPAPELGGKTPLEAARSPNLDRLADEGINGLQHAKSPGYPLGSPIALHLMFGYAEAEFPDRGPLIARARKIPIEDSDVLLSARFAIAERTDGALTLQQRFITDREADCVALGAAIEAYAQDGLRFRYRYTGGGDGILTIRGGASFQITDSDPLGLELPVLRCQARADASDAAAAQRTATALNGYLRWAHRTLSEQSAACAVGQAPINCLITKWAGPKPALEPFRAKWGLRAASLPDEEVVDGLMQELGFHLVAIAERGPERDLRARLEAARGLLAEGYEFIHLHTKYPDPTSHNNDPAGCVEEIEALDRGMDTYWETLADDADLVTVLTTDHTTPSTWTHVPRGQFFDQHGGEPSPIVIRGGHVRVDAVREFGERAAATGGLGHLRGEDFMPVLINAAERTNMYEMRPTPVRRLYRPGREDLDALDV